MLLQFIQFLLQFEDRLLELKLMFHSRHLKTPASPLQWDFTPRKCPHNCQLALTTVTCYSSVT